MQGGVKRVVGPLGVARNRKNTQELVGESVLTWDGSVKVKSFDEIASDPKQVVRGFNMNKYQNMSGPQTRIELERPPVSEEAISAEAEIMQYLASRNLTTTIIPDVRVGNGNSMFMEYVDNPYPIKREGNDVIEPDVAVECMHQLAAGLFEIWQEEGILNFDIKFDNLRLTNTGDVKVIDWGAAIKQEIPGADSVSSDEYRKKVSTMGYMPPETENKTTHLDIEKMIDYQVAAVTLRQLFGMQEVRDMLVTRGVGYEWKNMTMSPTQETFDTLWKESGIELPRKLVEIMQISLQENPQDRMSLSLTILSLEKVDYDDLVSYQGFAKKS